MAKINWIEAKKDYVTDPEMSYDKIAKKYGVNTVTVANRAAKHNWQEDRKKTLSKIEEKAIEKSTESISDFQAKKLKVGLRLVEIGAKGLEEHAPRNARESREIVDSGYKIATEAKGLDKPGVQVNVQNNIISIVDLVEAIEKRNAPGTNS